MSDDVAALANFGGVARLFPLPNLVLFPQVMQPLHIFEPRYRQMTAHALDGDRLLALALLRPGWEDDYEGRPRSTPSSVSDASSPTSGWRTAVTTCCCAG